MNLNDWRAEDLPPSAATGYPGLLRSRPARWIDWRNERFVVGAVVIGAVLMTAAICACIAAPKVACAMQTLSNDFCLKEIGGAR